MDTKTTDDNHGKPERKSYLAPSRYGLKAVTAHVNPEWVVNLKIYGAKKNRPLQSLFEEALMDLAKKLDIDLDSIEGHDSGER